MAATSIERILILAKTYPSPSARYVETSCVAGITAQGEPRRLFPVPFRLIEEVQQFKKWQWITVRVRKSNDDHRPESHRIYVDGLDCSEQSLSTDNQWAARRPWLDRFPAFDSFAAAEESRKKTGISLALVRPKRIVRLEITPARNPDWTIEERAKLIQEQMQGSLFGQTDAEKDMRELRKVPFDFHYVYTCDSTDGEIEERHKIVDWEAGALYWRCCASHGKNWEVPFRMKLEQQLPGADLMFLMGTIHRFPDQWLIVSLIYPPKRTPAQLAQTSLF